MGNSIRFRIANNIGWHVAGEFVGRGSVFLGNIYLARTLGPEVYGLLALWQASVMYAWLVMDWGVSIYGVKEVAQNPSRIGETFNNLTTLRLLLGVVALVFVVSGIEWVGDTGYKYKNVVIVCASLLVVIPFHAEWVLKGLERFSALLIVWIVFSIIYLGGLIGFVRSRNDVVIAAISWVAGYMAAGLVVLAYLSRLSIRFFPSFKLGVWTNHIKRSSLFALAGGLSATYVTIPLLIISVIGSPEVLGLLAAPLKLVGGIFAPGYYISMGYFPVMAELYENNRRAYISSGQEMKLILVLVGSLFAIVGYVFREEVCAFLFGGQYIGAGQILGLLVWTIPIGYLRYALTTTLRCSSYHRFQPIPYAAGIVAIAIGFVCMWWMGAVSPPFIAIPLVIGETAILSAYLWLEKRGGLLQPA